MEILREQYLQRLQDNKHNHLVKIITGLRRVGKSYLLFNLFKRQLLIDGVHEDHIISFSLDDFAYREFRHPDRLYTYVKERIKDSNMYYILLDEVQMLNDFVDVLNGFLHIDNVDVYVTGSNARFLSSDVVTEFRGRGVQVHVSPLTFREFMDVYAGTVQDGWREYMMYGGLPMVVLASSDQRKSEILIDLIKETYLRDIIARNQIRQDEELEELLLFLSSNIGSLCNPQKIANTMQSEKQVTITPNTCRRYIQAFADAFLMEQALRYDVKGKRYINTPQKYYFSDIGLRNALLRFRQLEPTHMMENILYNELRVRGYQVDVGVVENFSKGDDGKTKRSTLEIDFVCNRGFEKLYLQSAYSLPDGDKLTQEQRSLLALQDTFRKIIITADNVPSHPLENGIYLCNIYDLLMQQEFLIRESE